MSKRFHSPSSEDVTGLKVEDKVTHTLWDQRVRAAEMYRESTGMSDFELISNSSRAFWIEEARKDLLGRRGGVTDLNEGVPRSLTFTVNPDGATDVNPSHYDFPGGVQVIDITRHLDFLRGNAVKYLCRAGRKGDALTDLRKAKQYVEWAIEDAERYEQ